MQCNIDIAAEIPVGNQKYYVMADNTDERSNNKGRVYTVVRVGVSRA